MCAYGWDRAIDFGKPIFGGTFQLPHHHCIPPVIVDQFRVLQEGTTSFSHLGWKRELETYGSFVILDRFITIYK